MTTDLIKTLYFFDEQVDDFDCRITQEGKLLIKHRKSLEFTERDWYKNEKTGKPWFPAKRRSVVSLLKQSIREGDYDELKPKKVSK